MCRGGQLQTSTLRHDSLTSSQVTVKWLQIVMTVNALILLVMFSLQAFLRRKSRQARLNEPVPEEKMEESS